MRFKGTFILLIVCLALGGYLYFYEIKGGEEREKAREAEKRFWNIESKDIQQIELSPQDGNIVAVRKNEEEWAIEAPPRTLEADAGELDRLAERAAEIKFESILEQSAADPEKYGLEPAFSGFKIRTGDGKEYEIFFGNDNPAGNRTYARVSGRNEIFLVPSSASDTFDKKLDDLRNRSILRFEQPEVQTLTIKNKKGDIHLVKDEDDRWWIEGRNRIAADSPAIRGILNALSLGTIPEFFDEDPGEYLNAGMDKPVIDVSITYGKDKALKNLRIGPARANLRKKGTGARSPGEGTAAEETVYLAKDASRPEFFFVKQDLVDKLDTSAGDLRDRVLASFQRWDVDSITLENSNGRFTFTKDGGEWFFGDGGKKADFDAVNGILDALASDALDHIDDPAALSEYGLDEPAVHAVLKQGSEVLADCTAGETTDQGVYFRVQGDPAVKVADLEEYEKLTKNEADFIESPEPDESESAEE